HPDRCGCRIPDRQREGPGRLSNNDGFDLPLLMRNRYFPFSSQSAPVSLRSGSSQSAPISLCWGPGRRKINPSPPRGLFMALLVIVSLDSCPDECILVRASLSQSGVPSLVLDVSLGGLPPFVPDHSLRNLVSQSERRTRLLNPHDWAVCAS